MNKYNNKVIPIFLSFLFICITLLFLKSPGTDDVSIWQRWFVNIYNYGIISGFRINNADYPPLTTVILWCMVQIAHFFSIDNFTAIKLSIFIFLYLATFCLWTWTKNILLSVIFYVALFLNSVMLGYIDIYMAPTLILSLWALQKNRFLIFTILFTISSFIKWQPIIIAPFIFIYLLGITKFLEWKTIDFKNISKSVIFPSIIITFIILLSFGKPLIVAFANSITHHHLSGNALNFNWILTYLLHVFYPEKYGVLNNGQIEYIYTKSLGIIIIPKFLFIYFYSKTLYIFFMRKNRDFEDLLVFSIVGFWAYFIFNTGVHENHLFIPSILSIIWLWLNKENILITVFTIIAMNVNLIVFYGINGKGLQFSRVIGIDITLILSILYLIYFVVMFNKYNTTHKMDLSHTEA